MIFLLAHAIFTQDASACINGMFGAKRINLQQKEGPKSARQRVRMTLGHIHECLLESSPAELRDKTETTTLFFEVSPNRKLQKIRLQSKTQPRDLKKESLCVEKVLSRFSFPYEEGNSSVVMDLTLTHSQADLDALANVQPENLDGTYQLQNDPNTTLTVRVASKDYIKYTFQHTSPKKQCSFLYEGDASIQSVGVAFSSGECTINLEIAKDEITLTLDEYCHVLPSDSSCQITQKQELRFLQK